MLTGIARSGTTLARHLLNKLPDTATLHEPIPPGKFASLEGEETMLDEIGWYMGGCGVRSGAEPRRPDVAAKRLSVAARGGAYETGFRGFVGQHPEQPVRPIVDGQDRT